MNHLNLKKTISIILFTVLTLTEAFCLDLSDVNTKLSDVFDSLSDNNAGSTIFRSLNIPAGGRTESLGTAVTGLCDDSGFFDYNPAGSSVIERAEVALFHNSWIADSAMETLQFSTRFNNFGLGAQLKCFYVPFAEYNLYGDKVNGSYYSETSIAINMSYNFLAGYNFKGIALGYNVRGSLRKMPDYTNDQTDEIITGSGMEQSAVALMGDAGMLVRFNFLKHFNSLDPNLAFGLAINNLGVGFTGAGGTFQADDPLPVRISLGLSYRMLKHLLFTAEFRQPVNIYNPAKSEMWSAASGIEINVTNFFDFDAGFVICGANPRFSLGSQFDVKGVKMSVNYTVDLTTSFNPVNHISLCAKLVLSDHGRGLTTRKTMDKYAEGIEYYSKGKREDIVNAIRLWEEARDLSKSIGIRYDPAIEAIKTAQNLLNVHDQINAFGTLDRGNRTSE